MLPSQALPISQRYLLRISPRRLAGPWVRHFPAPCRVDFPRTPVHGRCSVNPMQPGPQRRSRIFGWVRSHGRYGENSKFH
jgi:hypothetical protein